jgi:hypothetical protein
VEIPCLLNMHIHNHIIKSKLVEYIFVASALVDLYFKFENVLNAHEVFDKTNEQGYVSWNAMIVGYT